MIPGYHTAGLLLHDVCVAIDTLAQIGYSCVAIRPHGSSFNPRSPSFSQQLLRLADAISRAQVKSVLDIDAPFLHDPCCFTGPSLVAVNERECGEARKWIEQWIGIAEELGSDLITFSSGITNEMSGSELDEQHLEQLAVQLNSLIDQTRSKKVRLAIRPRNGNAIATVAHFERLGQWLSDPESLCLAADVGDMLSGGELPLGDRLARNIDALACVYLCDRRAGQVGDQRIGHGDVALTRILRSLAEQGYQGTAIVRVEGYSELGFTPAREAIQIFEGVV